ncbi:cell division protein FtsQ [Balneicella halophila]|uniref:Cell division protein FtsQ n=1 Tax=Balneicella halophila TaxID=1537566 RepID=A0A7L4UP82_BALHA|nr:cell division protein FtsQ/DivIB [Balneicella halophila]PVX50943.1 cell division protein FtsQ [Balneicella halophila]
MKRNLKKILLFGLPLVLLLVYLAFAFFRIGQEEKVFKANGIVVEMTNPQFKFVNKKEILKIAEKQLGNTKDVKLDSINKNSLESAINKNPFVEDAQVFRSSDNACRIEITQRSPVLRVWTDTASYYLDKDGYKMPTGTKYAALVHMYRGNISESFAQKELLQFQAYLDDHSFWSEMIDYIMVNSKEELTLYLRAKSGKIHLGKPDNVAEKLEKLLLFINKVGKFNGLETYETIDLRYDNQVVVKKKEANATR